MSTLDVNFTDAIGNTFCRFEPKEMLCATRKLFSIFKMTLPSYCEKEKIPLPAHQIGVMKRLFDVFDDEN